MWPSTATAERDFDDLKSLEKLVVLGDSYSRVGFTSTGTQPSASNPFGNTATTSSGGNNWVQFLTLKYNESAFLTYDYALSGATVNVSIIENTIGVDIVTEADTFLSAYGSNSTFGGGGIIYAFWIGINDINKSYLGDDYAGIDLDIYAEVIDSYYQVVSKLYDSGARNFLFLNVPPLEKAPTILQSSSNSTKYPLMQRAVADYNEKLYKMVRQVRHNFAYTSVFFYDAHALFDAVLADPSQYGETASIHDTTSYCKDYAR
ncbi:hypothetical protein TruAng_008054 [Truncatella angustata]|nr:hypothetical protein TruAng_008054 [Truncatella angustata]